MHGPVIALLVHTIRFSSISSVWFILSEQILLGIMGTTASCNFSVAVSWIPVAPQPIMKRISFPVLLNFCCSYHRHALPCQRSFCQFQVDKQGWREKDPLVLLGVTKVTNDLKPVYLVSAEQCHRWSQRSLRGQWPCWSLSASWQIMLKFKSWAWTKVVTFLLHWSLFCHGHQAWWRRI